MSEFQLRHELAEEAKRLAAHPMSEVGRLEGEALEGASAASLAIIVGGVFVAVSVIAGLMFALVEAFTWAFA